MLLSFSLTVWPLLPHTPWEAPALQLAHDEDAWRSPVVGPDLWSPGEPTSPTKATHSHPLAQRGLLRAEGWPRKLNLKGHYPHKVRALVSVRKRVPGRRPQGGISAQRSSSCSREGPCRNPPEALTAPRQRSSFSHGSPRPRNLHLPTHLAEAPVPIPMPHPPAHLLSCPCPGARAAVPPVEMLSMEFLSQGRLLGAFPSCSMPLAYLGYDDNISLNDIIY